MPKHVCKHTEECRECALNDFMVEEISISTLALAKITRKFEKAYPQFAKKKGG